MAILKMKLIRAAGNLDKLDGFIEACFMSGEFHPENAASFMSASMGFVPLNEENPYAQKIQKIQELSAVLGKGLDAKPMSPGEAVEPQYNDIIGGLGEMLSKLHLDRKALTDQLEACQNGIVQFSHFESLDVNLDELFSCEFIKVRFGHMPRESYDKLLAYEDNPYLLFIPCSSDETDYWGVYFVPHHKSDEIDRIFSLLYFERIHIPGAAGHPGEAIKQLKANMEIINAQLEGLDKELSGYWNENEQKINGVYSGLTWLSDAFEMRRFAAVRGRQFYYIGWIPLQNLNGFQENVSRLPDINCEVSEPEKQVKTAPVKIKNNRLIRPFEYFVTMYGLPSYGGTDVTAFVAVTYTLIFGIMFGDLGQGLVLALAGLLMWKIKKMPLGKILIPCGLSSMFFGLVFGSFFGYEEALNPLYEVVGLNGKPLEVMDSINTIVLMSVGMGVALVLLSMAIHVYDSAKRKHWGEAFFSNNGVAGIVFYTFLVLAAAGFMSGRKLVPGWLTVTALALSAVLLFHKEIFISILDRHESGKPENLTDFLLQNVFELLEYLLSYFSNTVSFLRVGAFVLVHAGMMMVVFSLAGENRNIVVIILGNILVVTLEGLLTGIQALRLEFYEMFSRFLEGDGRPFTAAGPAVHNKQ